MLSFLGGPFGGPYPGFTTPTVPGKVDKKYWRSFNLVFEGLCVHKYVHTYIQKDKIT